MISIKGVPSKAFATIKRILKEFFSTWSHFSFKLAVYRLSWWLAYYIPSLKALHRWSSRGKANYVNRYIEENFSDIIDKYRTDGVVQYREVENYRIWIFWAQGIENAPELVKGCYKQLLKTNGERVILITMDNLQEYINIPQYIMDKVYRKELTITHFSDIIRVLLLAEYGGLWVDSTLYLTGSLPIYVTDSRLFSPPAGWCMGANVYNYILFAYMRDMLLSYWKRNNTLIEFFLIDYIINYAREYIPIIKSDFDNIPPNNPRYSMLVNLLNTKWSEELYNQISENTWIFKLSYKADWRAEVDGEPTFYGKLILNS